ncbi:replication protein A 14 kDa subunit [Lolium perenne]|uniref:replication protein A 14 kDa subunit n=1 Tax=Lolium perenne TaxID=4522 RepID=UPI0021EA99E6|nr:replication protein A 14 kDa subunit-like [Lolium perenne]
MDMNHPSALVNGDTLKMFVGRKVRTVVKVQRTEGGVLFGQSTDGHQLTIKGALEGVGSHYLEVVGIADNAQSITAEICKDFGENFDAEAFNGLCKVSMDNKVKELFL